MRSFEKFSSLLSGITKKMKRISRQRAAAAARSEAKLFLQIYIDINRRNNKIK